MEIRRKLAFQFIGLVAFILFFSFLLIYISFSKGRHDEFFDRLSSKAKLVAQMYIDIEEIDGNLLTKIESKNPLNLPNEILFIYDYTNKLVYSKGDTAKITISQKMIDKVRLNEEILQRQGKFEIYGIYYKGKYDRYVVFCSASDIFGLLKQKRLLIILIIVFFLNLIFVYFFGKQFSARALNPIANIIKQVDKIEISNLKVKLDEGNRKDELALLAMTFNNMLHRVDSAFEMQKSFISNASHELKTPLTSLTGQLEVALLKNRDTEEYISTIQWALDDIQNLNQVVNKLLVLAQASSDYTKESFVSLRIDDLLWQARLEILKRNPEYSIIINFDETIDDEKQLMVSGNELLLKVVLNNLIDNGCKYSTKQEVTVNLKFTNNHLNIHFIDEGEGISPDEIKKITQPFYRGSNSYNKKGVGIGLSLVAKIIELHKGSLICKSQLKVGSEFTISIPSNF